MIFVEGFRDIIIFDKLRILDSRTGVRYLRHRSNVWHYRRLQVIGRVHPLICVYGTETEPLADTAYDIGEKASFLLLEIRYYLNYNLNLIFLFEIH